MTGIEGIGGPGAPRAAGRRPAKAGGFAVPSDLGQATRTAAGAAAQPAAYVSMLSLQELGGGPRAGPRGATSRQRYVGRPGAAAACIAGRRWRRSGGAAAAGRAGRRNTPRDGSTAGGNGVGHRRARARGAGAAPPERLHVRF